MNYDSIIQRIPSDNNYDVIVCGASPSGLAAAAASAHVGAQTLLFESGSRLCQGLQRCRLNGGGVFAEYMRYAAEAAAVAYAVPDPAQLEGRYLPPEAFSMSAFQCLERADCRYRLHSPVIRGIKSGERMTGVAVSTKMGERIFHGHIVIDGTGSHELSRTCGCAVQENASWEREALGFVIMNVGAAFFDYLASSAASLEALMREASGELKAYDFRFEATLPESAVYVRSKYRIQPAGTSPEAAAAQRTRTRQSHLKMAVECVEMLRKRKIPGMSSAALMRTDESVSLHAHYEIAAGAPLQTGEGLQHGHSGHQALIPNGVQNLLLSSSLSAETAGLETQMQMGTTAGVMAALSSLHNTQASELPFDVVKATLDRLQTVWR